ncbi:MAG: undecaprenyl-diphosphate phosphatase [Chlorobi bacterium]|nr:undecaprenyl-diphosphate phosphatase [Chlorobiota bacterium]
MNWFQAIIIAIVEGITEFLPISSTGHMIITEGILGMKSNDFIQAFIINIQFGAILSVVILYWKRFFQTMTFYYKLFVAFLPAAVIGLLLSDFIDDLLENIYVVASMLIVGGVILIFVDKWYNKPSKNQEITYKTALKIGFFQTIAMIPGVSRSAATIVGGMTQKLSRKTAAEFSFFLAVPTMFAAAGYKLFKNHEAITNHNIVMLIVGNLVAFVVALFAIKYFIAFLTKYGFKWFGYYRIAIGLLILIFIFFGYDLTVS